MQFGPSDKSISMTLRRLELQSNEPLGSARTSLEASIISVFKETFELDQVGAEDDFFELGGDSFTAEVLALNILKRTGLDFKIFRLLFESTPHAIAELLEENASKPAAYKRPPLFMVHGRDGVMLPSKTFLNGLAPDQPLE